MKVTPIEATQKPAPTISAPTISNSKTDQNKIENEKTGGVRYMILIVSMICLSSLMSNVVCFNFTIMCMPGIGESEDLVAFNKTQYDGYTRTEKTWLLSIVAVGAMIGVFPVTYGISVYGGKKIFTSAGILTTIATLLIPIFGPLDFNVFLALRFLQGVAFASVFPTVGSITSSWASLTQQGLFIAALTTFGQLSSIFSMPVAGELCVSPFGWKSVFYLHAFISVIAFTIWFFIFTDSPSDNKYVLTAELNEIQRDKSSEANAAAHERAAIPYLEILTTPSIWAVWVGALGDLIAVQLIHIYSPVYLHDIGGYSMKKTGLAAAVPVLFQFFVKLSAGHSSDRLHGVSETVKLRIFNTIALGASAAFLIALGFVDRGHGLLGLTLMTLATAMFGFNGGGFSKCAALVSRQYSHFVMANIQFLLCFSMLLCPILVSFLLKDGTIEEWRMVFFVHAGILIVCNAFFCWFATAKPAPWTDRSISASSSKNTPLYTYRV
ncbi:unnamed protein product [Caenorhabditis angaria]|uniref:Major facilitator superfamily (MFS) profile domain-containing protein n=1 Tax=Caenorhabditis angaria TaxID=860376 RepID=A0A9P1IUC5_9PELO|nr:unnamed protein product [Caenorhabditis angaria]